MTKINLNIEASVFLPTFRPYITDYTKRYNIFWGGRASGKTYFCVQKLILKGLQEKRFILLMNKQTNKLKDGVWRELRQSIEFFKLTDYFEFNKTDFRATCKINGTEIRCLGIDEPEKIKGYADISDVYLDELTSFTMDDFDLIDGTLRSKRYNLPLQIYASFNPVSKANWVYKYFHFDTGDYGDNILVHHSTYLDNPHADTYAYMERLKQSNPARYKIEALGEFASLDKLVYPYWTEGLPPDDKSELELLCGLDFGYTNDATAFVASYLDKDNGKLYIYDEYYKTGMLNSDISTMLIQKGYGKEIIIADSAEPKSIEEIKRNGVIRIKPAVKGKDSILSGIQLIQQYDIVVNPECSNVICELENYCWTKDKNTGEYINQPIDTFNHCMDALRYSIQTTKNKIRVVNRNSLGL